MFCKNNFTSFLILKSISGQFYSRLDSICYYLITIPMSNKYTVPSLEQIINNHIQDIDFLNLRLENIMGDTILTKSLPIHRKNFILASKVTNNKPETRNSSIDRSKVLRRSQSLKKSQSIFTSKDSSFANNSNKKQKIDKLLSKLQESPAKQNTMKTAATSSDKNKTIFRSSSARRTLTRFLFQFQIPEGEERTHQEVKPLSTHVSKINNYGDHNTGQNLKNKNSLKFRKLYMMQPLSIQTKPIYAQVRKARTTPNENLQDKRSKSCYFKTGQKDNFECQNMWELKPWVAKHEFQV